MIWALYLTKLVHILGIGVWIGVEAGISSDIRRSLAKGPPHAAFMAERVNRNLKIAMIAAILATLSGVGMIFLSGGFGAVSPRIHTGFLLTLIILGLDFALVRPAAKKLTEAVASDDKLAEADGPRKKIAAFMGVKHLLWMITMVLMVFKF